MPSLTSEQLLELKKKPNLTMKEKLILAKAEKDVSVSSRNTNQEKSMFSVKTEANRQEFIKIADIKPNPFQPRKHLSTNEIEEFAESIVNDGLLQPILVTSRDGEIILIAGQKRLKAYKQLNKKEEEQELEPIEMKYFKIACLVLDNSTDIQIATMAIVENQGRKNPLFLDTANAVKAHFDMSQEEDKTLSQNKYAEIAAKVFNIGTKGTVSKYLKIATLEKEVQEEVFKIEFNLFTKLYNIAKSTASIEEKIEELYKEDEEEKDNMEDFIGVEEEQGESRINETNEPRLPKSDETRGDEPRETVGPQEEQGQQNTKKSKSKIDIDYLIGTIKNLAASTGKEKGRIEEELLDYLLEF